MWVWLTISMLLVVACIIFGIYSFLGSRGLQKSIAAEPVYLANNLYTDRRSGLPALKKQALNNLKTKIKSVEENSLLNIYHLSELQKRIEVLESSSNLNTANEEVKQNNSGEDWEKLYYQTKKEKQLLENNFNDIKNTLQETINKMKELEKQQAASGKMKSDIEFTKVKVNSLQQNITGLQHKLEATRQREAELEEQLEYEKSKQAGYELLEKQNAQLQSELDILNNRLQQVSEQNTLLKEKIKRLTELGSILEISEYEKLGIKNSVEQLLQM